jgi:hypothetical protein
MSIRQDQIIKDLESRALFTLAQAARSAWENGLPFFSQTPCGFELRLRFAEGNEDLYFQAREQQRPSN